MDGLPDVFQESDLTLLGGEDSVPFLRSGLMEGLYTLLFDLFFVLELGKGIGGRFRTCGVNFALRIP
ncbi:MAG: hypothetical protein UW23_C0008G0022 [Candidatus Collierbacteria bacterium GW2011_GWA1_44_12]|uniref:Uncharacterized protein n=1 Tax=Candidatus Collierbacteria bacterium GW2011_GWA1_44_12 TaxID=1618376 RepID=A0A0G1GNE2_9BACT|nr:MAG: hypothetical protein UW23_C0008G0022 [Candidatus Collierbacteria bacterium GW2011_GWA1_44_12]